MELNALLSRQQCCSTRERGARVRQKDLQEPCLPFGDLKPLKAFHIPQDIQPALPCSEPFYGKSSAAHSLANKGGEMAVLTCQWCDLQR